MECTTQTEVNKAVKAGDIPIVRSGFFDASDSATVRAYGSATVRASDSATVRAYGSATVTASKMVPVHVFSGYGTPKVSGGIVLKVPNLDKCDAATWLDYNGITPTKAGYVTLFKAVGEDWQANHGASWTYEPGTAVTAEDYQPTRACGAGLHLGATPHQAGGYYNGVVVRYVACKVKVSELIPLGDKCKTRSVKVLHEVDIDGVKVQR